jgi:RNA polymerase sigma-70 factor (ECF subfamily)
MEMSERAEQALVERLLAGDNTAVREFYGAFERRVRRYVARRIDLEEDCEEIVQDVFWSAIESLGLYSGKGRLFFWLCGIARHEVADFYRKKRLKQVLWSQFPFLDEVLADEATVEDWYNYVELRQKIERVLRGLLPRYAQVLRMKYLEGWRVAEMAEELGETFKATETVLFRARKAFAVAWEEAG